MRLVIHGVKINLKTRHSTYYLLRDMEAVKTALSSGGQLNVEDLGPGFCSGMRLSVRGATVTVLSSKTLAF